jgi:succinoglycan biosynthesis transport protein ExoP
MEVDTGAPADLRRSVHMLWRRKAWMVGAVVLAVLISLALSLQTTKLYESSAQVQLLDLFQSSAFGETPVLIANPTQVAESQIAVVESPRVARQAAQRLGSRHSEVNSVGARAVGESTLLDIRVTSTSRTVARDGANAYAQAYSNEAKELVSRAYNERSEELDRYADELQQRIADVGTRIDELNNEIALLEGGTEAEARSPDVQARLATLAGQLQGFEANREALAIRAEETTQRGDELRVEANALANSVARIVSFGRLPSEPFSPTTIRDAWIAAAIGLVVGLGLAFGREALEPAVRGPEDVVRLLPDVPLLGTTLSTGAQRNRLRIVLARLFGRTLGSQGPPAKPVVFADPASAPAEAYRSVRTSLARIVERGVVLVTSPAPRDGKTVTAVNLAASLAVDGRRVILVSCDLRRPSVHEHFQLGNDVGVTSVLQGHAPLDEALQHVPGTSELLAVLPSGPLPPNPAEMLSSAAAGDLLHTLRTMAAYVIVDSPPCLVVTDAVVTARWADAVILVARQGSTTQSALSSATDRMRESGASRVCAIVAGVPAPRRSLYSHPYQASTPTSDDGESSDDIVEDEGDLVRAAGLPVLGDIPAPDGEHLSRLDVTTVRLSPAVAEAYGTLRTNVKFLDVEESIRTLHVTSVDMLEAKTSTVANLATSFAQAGKQVIALCCDWRHPRLHELFGVSDEVGFTTVVLGDRPISGALQPVGLGDRLMVMASGQRPPNPSGLLASPRASAVIEDLTARCDLLLIESPPVLAGMDALVLAGIADATLLVADARVTSKRSLRRAVDALEEVDARVVGTVLSRISSDRTSHPPPGDGVEHGRPAPDAVETGITPRAGL